MSGRRSSPIGWSGRAADPDNARSLATLTIAAIEGAVIIALATQSTAALDDVGRHLIEAIRLHT